MLGEANFFIDHPPFFTIITILVMPNFCRREHKMYLSDLKKGQKAKILRVSCERTLAHRLADMGVKRDAVVTIKPDAPLGDPMHLMVLDYDFTLRKADACQMEVMVVL